MKIQVTEHKSSGALPATSHLVRIFVDGDYHYGYWVDEHALVASLTEEQKEAYLLASADIRLDVAPTVAQHLINIGQTPGFKQTVA